MEIFLFVLLGFGMLCGYVLSNKEPLGQLLVRTYGTGACARYYDRKYGLDNLAKQ